MRKLQYIWEIVIAKLFLKTHNGYLKNIQKFSSLNLKTSLVSKQRADSRRPQASFVLTGWHVFISPGAEFSWFVLSCPTHT